MWLTRRISAGGLTADCLKFVLSRAPTSGAGAVSRRGLGRRAHLGPGLQVDPIVADGRFEVCAGCHMCFVMTKESV